MARLGKLLSATTVAGLLALGCGDDRELLEGLVQANAPSFEAGGCVGLIVENLEPQEMRVEHCAPPLQRLDLFGWSEVPTTEAESCSLWSMVVPSESRAGFFAPLSKELPQGTYRYLVSLAVGDGDWRQAASTVFEVRGVSESTSCNTSDAFYPDA